MAGTVNVVKGKYPHLGWVDIEGRGVVTEVAVLKNGTQGLYYIRINKLDLIDKQRLFKIVTNRNAGLYELWDLMSNITLGNGANALEYFHQYVKILTPSGQILTPSMSRMVDPRWTGVRQQQPSPQAMHQQQFAPQQTQPQQQTAQPPQQPVFEQKVSVEAPQQEEKPVTIKRTRKPTRKTTG